MHVGGAARHHAQVGGEAARHVVRCRRPWRRLLGGALQREPRVRQCALLQRQSPVLKPFKYQEGSRRPDHERMMQACPVDKRELALLSSLESCAVIGGRPPFAWTAILPLAAAEQRCSPRPLLALHLCSLPWLLLLSCRSQIPPAQMSGSGIAHSCSRQLFLCNASLHVPPQQSRQIQQKIQHLLYLQRCHLHSEAINIGSMPCQHVRRRPSR